MKTREEKTRKHEVIERGEITCNCNVSIGLLAIDWQGGLVDVWYGFTPFGHYKINNDKDRWSLKLIDGGIDGEYESLQEAVDAAQADYVRRIGWVLRGRVSKKD